MKFIQPPFLCSNIKECSLLGLSIGLCFRLQAGSCFFFLWFYFIYFYLFIYLETVFNLYSSDALATNRRSGFVYRKLETFRKNILFHFIYLFIYILLSNRLFKIVYSRNRDLFRKRSTIDKLRVVRKLYGAEIVFFFVIVVAVGWLVGWLKFVQGKILTPYDKKQISV